MKATLFMLSVLLALVVVLANPLTKRSANPEPRIASRTVETDLDLEYKYDAAHNSKHRGDDVEYIIVRDKLPSPKKQPKYERVVETDITFEVDRDARFLLD